MKKQIKNENQLRQILELTGSILNYFGKKEKYEQDHKRRLSHY